MPKAIKTKKSEETRRRIFDSALALFRKRGFDETTMRDIASEADVALGAAYYYFDSKDAIVMAFYQRTQDELVPLVTEALSHTHSFKQRLAAVIRIKLDYCAPNRRLMAALATHIDPRHPLSPFSEQTRAIRDADTHFFQRALEGSDVRVSEDLALHLPRLLWLYQMGLLLFWVYDRSPRQWRTTQLFEKTLSIVTKLVRFSSFPLLRPVRKTVAELLELIYGSQETSEALA
jgi:AcrR family transcriptional regulator